MKKRQVVLKRGDHYCSNNNNNNNNNNPSSSYTVRRVRYGECQRNHAANVGGYAVDGCREFMPSGDEGTEGALACAACGCHRNFHRRQVETEVVCDCAASDINLE